MNYTEELSKLDIRAIVSYAFPDVEEIQSGVAYAKICFGIG